MNIRGWTATSIAIVAMAAANCGGDDSALTETSGASGTTGSAGAGTAGAGTAGAGGSSTGSAGSSGTSSGSGGSATGGSGGGATSSGGSTGTAGSGGAGTGTGGINAGSGGGNADASAGSGGATDAGRSDSTINPPVDSGIADADACPAAEPMMGTTCMGSAICTYGNVGCGCVRAGGGMNRQWQCRRIPDAAPDPDCPATPPARRSSCADAGSGTFCQYGPAMFCACNQQDQWQCTF